MNLNLGLNLSLALYMHFPPKGRSINLVTSSTHHLNAEINRLPGTDAFPAAGTW